MKWFGKRGVGAINLLRGRGRYFDDAEEKMAALARFKQEQAVDLVICTGDYTALGLEKEIAHARTVIEPLTDAPAGFVTVPGNHDIYVMDVIRHGFFKRHFSDFLYSDLPSLCSDDPWPLVRFVGDDMVVIGVNSARPNPQPWRSNGEIPSQQLDALSKILEHEQVRHRFVFLITHYAPCLADGHPDRKLHGLNNADEFLALGEKISSGAILFGHVHRRFQVKLPALSAGLFCAGSATQAGSESFWLFEVDSKQARALPGGFDGKNYTLNTDSAIKINTP